MQPNDCDVYASAKVEDGCQPNPSRVRYPTTPPPPPPTPTPGPQGVCVKDETDFRDAIRTCDNVLCAIEVCQPGMSITDAFNNGKGVEVSHKSLVISCQRTTTSERCILDGLKKSSLFYGSNTNIKFQNFIFANGINANAGGAIQIINNSILVLLSCSFQNNDAPFGSAISISDSTLIMDGRETSVTGNIGKGAPIEVKRSLFNISHATFSKNNVTKNYGDAIFALGTTLNIVNVTSIKASEDDFCENCDVYLSSGDNVTSDTASCITFSNRNTPFPLVDFAEQCSVTKRTNSTNAPTPTKPTPQPSVCTCFSAENSVEVRDKGTIHMNQLQIGDYVKSGMGQFVLVYGFGHYEPNREEIYLRMELDNNSKLNGTVHDDFNKSVLTISSSHLIFVDNKIPAIRAADVRVGDELNGKIVKAIRIVTRRGVYAPLTSSGDIVVSGIVASNYVDVFFGYSYESDTRPEPWDLHMIGHILFTPQRFFCHYFLEICQKEYYINGYGILSYLMVWGSKIVHPYRYVNTIPLDALIFSSIILVMTLRWMNTFVFSSRSSRIKPIK
jgi:Hint module